MRNKQQLLQDNIKDSKKELAEKQRSDTEELNANEVLTIFECDL